MKVRRLTAKHPTMKKIDEVFALMKKLGLVLDPYCRGTCVMVLRDKDFPGAEFELRDVEDSSNAIGSIHELPPAFEYKLTTETDR